MSRKRIERIHELTKIILDGLNGNPFSWGNGQRMAWVPLLREIGITLVTKTQIEKRGLVLKRGAKPIGNAYFGAPIKRYADLYVLEVQCTKPKKPETDCWLFLDCEIVTGKPPEKCPNRKQCKQNALHSQNRYCNLPCYYGTSDNVPCLVVDREIPEEAKSVGWHPALKLFYEYRNTVLLIDGNIPQEAQTLGFAKAELTPYYANSRPGFLYVTRYSPMSYYPVKFKKAGWYPAVDLPHYFDWDNDRKSSFLKVNLDIKNPENAEAIAYGWHPACKIRSND